MKKIFLSMACLLGMTAATAQVNQARIAMTSGDVKYYNTESLNAIQVNQANGEVKVEAKDADAAVFTNSVASISFIRQGAVKITKAAGWLESAYAEWELQEGASSYAVYVKGGQYADYTKIDAPLVRHYPTFGRADAVGLKAGEYSLKVVPIVDGQEIAANAAEVSGLLVKGFNRDGYAHYNATAGIGAYNNDGTLKTGARVLYVTKQNAKTITLDMLVGSNKTETRTGIQDILQAYEKGIETRPLVVRIIGQLKKADMPELGSSAIGLQVKGKGQNMNLTIEGIGNDATLHGFGVLCRACKYVELRNFAVMMHPEDGISFDTDNEHLWGHHLDIFYGENKGGDKSKGDGSFDVKGTFYCTVSDNHFWDSGKCNLNSNGDEVDFVSYHHNWYDHSDSRHPRVRKSQHLHVFNNYYDGNSKYGVGATTGSCIFVEKNYYRNCKYPMLISKQGSDIHNGVGSSNDTKGTFSSEDGGIIKAFDNYMTGQTSFEPYVAGHATYSKHFDAYVVQSRDEQVPAEVVTLQGGTGYNNFDTAADFYTYTPDATADVPATVTGQYGAGRCEHGDFQYAFDNATQDKNYDVIIDLSNKLKDYTTTLLGVFGEEQAQQGGEQGGGEQGGGEQGGGEVTPAPEGTIFCSFDGTVSNSMFSVNEGNLGDGKITYEGVYYKKGEKLDSKGYIKFTPQKNYLMTIVFSMAKPGRSVKLNGTETTATGTDNAEGNYCEVKGIPVTAGTECNLTKGSAESMVMIIKLEPTE